MTTSPSLPGNAGRKKENMIGNLEILMMDSCTKSEAKKFLKNGTIVFNGEDFEGNIDAYLDEWSAGYSSKNDEDYIQMCADVRRMIETKIPMTDWGIVEHNGYTWYIMYTN